MAGLRKVNTVVISDVHLGTYGCQAKALLYYLKSIDPQRIILNGDIIDIWQFNKRYWPKSHMKIIKHLMKWIVAGKQVHYITGNHDEMLRKFKNYQIGNFSIVNKLVVDLDGEKAWFFHGDIFDFNFNQGQISSIKFIFKSYLIVSSVCFITGELTKNYSQIDKVWSLVPIFVVWYFTLSSNFNPRMILMSVLVTIWGLRLTYNFSRRGDHSIYFW